MTPEQRAREIAAQWPDGTDQATITYALALAIREEREACAKVAEEWRATSLMEENDWHTAMASVADEIRKRS